MKPKERYQQRSRYLLAKVNPLRLRRSGPPYLVAKRFNPFEDLFNRSGSPSRIWCTNGSDRTGKPLLSVKFVQSQPRRTRQVLQPQSSYRRGHDFTHDVVSGLASGNLSGRWLERRPPCPSSFTGIGGGRNIGVAPELKAFARIGGVRQN